MRRVHQGAAPIRPIKDPEVFGCRTSRVRRRPGGAKVGVNAKDTSDITGLLLAWRAGDREAGEDLMSAVYDELRRIAGCLLNRRPSGDCTLQPTALVNEVYFRLVKQERVEWRDRAHFFGIAAKMMRRVAVDQARQKRAAKRRGGTPDLSLTDHEVAVDGNGQDAVVLDQALRRLAELEPDGALVVELRFFGGLTMKEVAVVQGCSLATVERRWHLARAWLYRELK